MKTTINWPFTLRRWRGRHRLSQAGAAAALGIKCRTLQEWEQGRREPGPLTREAVAARMAAAGKSGAGI